MKWNAVFALVMLMSGACLAASPSPVLSERYIQLMQIERNPGETSSQHATRIRQVYEAWFAHDQSRARRASIADLEPLFDAAYRQAEWGIVDNWDTPVFYFIRDGKLFGKITGWSLDSTRGPMESMLRKQGLIPEGN